MGFCQGHHLIGELPTCKSVCTESFDCISLRLIYFIVEVISVGKSTTCLFVTDASVILDIFSRKTNIDI